MVTVMLEILLHISVPMVTDWLEHLHVSVNSLRDGMELNHIVHVSGLDTYTYSVQCQSYCSGEIQS